MLSFWWKEIDARTTNDKAYSNGSKDCGIKRENINLVVKGMVVEGTWEGFMMEWAFAMVLRGRISKY